MSTKQLDRVAKREIRIDNAVEDTVNRDDRLARQLASITAGTWICGVLLTFYTLYIGRNLFVPIFLAVFAYLTLRPIIRGCTRAGIPPAVSAAAVLLSLVLAIGTASYLLSGPAQEIMREAPRSFEEIKHKLAFVFERLRTVNEATENISDAAVDENIADEEKPVPVEIKQPAWSTDSPVIAGTGNLVSFLAIVIVLLYFLMATGDQLLRSVTTALPTFSSKRRLVELLENVEDALSSYLAWVTAINACLGIAVGTAMWLLGMPSPLLWGVAAFTLNYIPIVGALVGVGMVFLVALVNFDTASQAFIVAGTYGLLTTFEGQFITPSLLGKSMKLNSILVFLSIVLWGWMWGMMGVFLAVPILITVMMIGEKMDSMASLTRVFGGVGRPAEES